MARYATGKYAKAISDRSGMEFPYKEMVREWNGAFVHSSEYEPKQPQLEPKPNGADGVSLLNTRTDRNEPPTAVALPKDPFTVTNGSATLTVSLLNHSLQVGDFVLFFNGASNDPTQSFGLGSNLFPLFAATTVRLPNNPFETYQAGSAIINVFAPGHGLTDSTTYRFRGAPTTSPGTGTSTNPVFAYAAIPNFDGISGSNITKAAGYTIRTGKYKAGARDASNDYLTSNFFFFTVDTNTATSGNIKGGGYGCSVGPITIEA